MKRLEGRIALVTGAARGIGEAIAQRYVAEGATVICADLSPAVHDLTKSLGEAAVPVVLDVTKEDDIAAVFAMARERWGKVDVLCNNAGVSGRRAKAAEYDLPDLYEVIDVNLRATFLTMKYAIPMMAAAGGGSIVNIASAAGLVGIIGRALYSASKSGVVGLTRSAALDYGPDEIRVNAICPGGVFTPLYQQVNTAASQAAWLERHALKRICQPSEIASVAAFLASDDASYVTGVAIPVDGGLTAA